MLHIRNILLVTFLFWSLSSFAKETYRENGHKPIHLSISKNGDKIAVGKLRVVKDEAVVYEAIMRQLWARGARDQRSMQQFAKVMARKVIAEDFVSSSGEIEDCGNGLSLSVEVKKDHLEYTVSQYRNGSVQEILKTYQGKIDALNCSGNDESVLRALLRLISKHQWMPNDKIFITTNDNHLHIGEHEVALSSEIAKKLSGVLISEGSYYIADAVYISGDNQDRQCNCEGFGADSVEIYAMRNCNGCTDHNLLIYDAKCKQFWQYKDGNIRKILDINDVRLFYKKQFKIKVIRLNRYLNSVNIGNSDIAFTSTPSIQMQSALPGSGTGQVTVYNSGTNNTSNSSASNIFNEISGIRADANYLEDAFISIRQRWLAEQSAIILSLASPDNLIKYDRDLHTIFDGIKDLGDFHSNGRG